VALLSGDADPETERRLVDAGASVERIEGMRRIPRPGGVRALSGRLRSLRPAVVHVSLTDQGDGLGPIVSAVLLARRPTLASLHLVIPNRAIWREGVSAFALRRPDSLVAVSESVAAYARGRGAAATVILNGVDPPSLAPDARAGLGIPHGRFVVGGIGRLVDQKGWDVLGEAMQLVREQRPDIQAVVVGDGPDRGELERRIPSDAVAFVGYREQASSLLGAFDVLAVPSRYEAFGRVAAEAMMSGVPVIASAVDGLPEVLGDTGVLVAPERPDLLAEAIVGLAADAERRRALSEAALVRAGTLFGAVRMTQQFEELYRSLAA
jgi:glycosyltransferase involved in cell wall biosynthesis